MTDRADETGMGTKRPLTEDETWDATNLLQQGIVHVLANHEYQEWRPTDGLLYPDAGQHWPACSCGASPASKPEYGDWGWWCRHVASEYQAATQGDQ